MIFHRHHHTTLHDDDCQEAHARVCVISRCPITQCWTKIKVTAWATAAFRQANNCAWPAGVPSLNAGLKTRRRCLGNCCIQTGKCQCMTSRCPITKCWTSKKQTRSLSGRLLHSNGHSMSQGKGILAAVDLIQKHAALMIVHKSGWVCRPYPLMGKHLTALQRAPGQNYYTLTSEG